MIKYYNLLWAHLQGDSLGSIPLWPHNYVMDTNVMDTFVHSGGTTQKVTMEIWVWINIKTFEKTQFVFVHLAVCLVQWQMHRHTNSKGGGLKRSTRWSDTENDIDPLLRQIKTFCAESTDSLQSTYAVRHFAKATNTVRDGCIQATGRLASAACN